MKQDNLLVYPQLSYKVVGCCMKVHRHLGPRLLEKYYQRALAQEFKESNLSYQRELAVEIKYSGVSIGRYFVDFLVEDKILLELKAQKEKHSAFYKQTLAYIRELDVPLGLIVNFRVNTLKPYRVINSKWSGFNNSNRLENN